MDRQREDEKFLDNLINPDESKFIDKPAVDDRTDIDENNKTHVVRKYHTKHMRIYPELYRSDVSINPSYTGLKNLPYYVICRRRALKRKKQITRQLNREIMHIAMMQSYALGGMRIDRIFSVGLSMETNNVQDFATTKERRRINQLLNER